MGRLVLDSQSKARWMTNIWSMVDMLIIDFVLSSREYLQLLSPFHN